MTLNDSSQIPVSHTTVTETGVFCCWLPELSKKGKLRVCTNPALTLPALGTGGCWKVIMESHTGLGWRDL